MTKCSVAYDCMALLQTGANASLEDSDSNIKIYQSLTSEQVNMCIIPMLSSLYEVTRSSKGTI